MTREEKMKLYLLHSLNVKSFIAKNLFGIKISKTTPYVLAKYSIFNKNGQYFSPTFSEVTDELVTKCMECTFRSQKAANQEAKERRKQKNQLDIFSKITEEDAILCLKNSDNYIYKISRKPKITQEEIIL